MPASRTRTAGMALLAVGLLATIVGTVPAGAAEAPVGLGTADSFAVLGGSTVTNTGSSVISGDLGVSPGTAVTGFPPGTVNDGTIHATDAVAAQAQSDLTDAYNDAAGRSTTAAVTADLAGQTLVAGVYSGDTLALSGSLTLDAQGDPDAVFIFQAAGSTLVTASNSVVALTNGAQACNVFWQVASSATLGTDSVFVGSVLALTSITADTGASVVGRLLARNAAVTLDSNTITRPTCATDTTTTTTTTTTAASAPGTGTDGSDGSDGLPVGGAAGAPDDGIPGDDAAMTPAGATPAGATPAGATPGGSAPGLPVTGTGINIMTAMGLLAVAVGVAMLAGTRRRTIRRA